MTPTIRLLLRQISIEPYSVWYSATRLILADALADEGDEREEQVRTLVVTPPIPDHLAPKCLPATAWERGNWLAAVQTAEGLARADLCSDTLAYLQAEEARDAILGLFPEVELRRAIFRRLADLPDHWTLYGQVLHSPGMERSRQEWASDAIDRGPLADVAARLKANLATDGVAGTVDVVWPAELAQSERNLS